MTAELVLKRGGTGVRSFPQRTRTISSLVGAVRVCGTFVSSVCEETRTKYKRRGEKPHRFLTTSAARCRIDAGAPNVSVLGVALGQGD